MNIECSVASCFLNKILVLSWTSTRSLRARNLELCFGRKRSPDFAFSRESRRRNQEIFISRDLLSRSENSILNSEIRRFGSQFVNRPVIVTVNRIHEILRELERRVLNTPYLPDWMALKGKFRTLTKFGMAIQRWLSLVHYLESVDFGVWFIEMSYIVLALGIPPELFWEFFTFRQFIVVRKLIRLLNFKYYWMFWILLNLDNLQNFFQRPDIKFSAAVFCYLTFQLSLESVWENFYRSIRLGLYFITSAVEQDINGFDDFELSNLFAENWSKLNE